MKYITTVLIILCVFSLNIYAQNVSLNKKDNSISIDGKVVLKYKKQQMTNWSLFDMNGEELVYFTISNNGTPQYDDDDFFIINFLPEKVKVETNDYTNIQTFFNFNKALEKFVAWLLREKALNSDGTLNPEKVETFRSKYDQNITNRTILH